MAIRAIAWGHHEGKHAQRGGEGFSANGGDRGIGPYRKQIQKMGLDSIGSTGSSLGWFHWRICHKFHRAEDFQRWCNDKHWFWRRWAALIKLERENDKSDSVKWEWPTRELTVPISSTSSSSLSSLVGHSPSWPSLTQKKSSGILIEHGNCGRGWPLTVAKRHIWTSASWWCI